MDIENLYTAIDSGNQTRARSILLAQLDADRFHSVMEVSSQLNILLKLGSTLFEEEDGEFDFYQKDKWNRPYWTRMCVELSENFSEKKLRHVIEVMEFLRKQGDPKFTPKNKPESRKNGSNRNSPSVTIVMDSKTLSKSILQGAGIGAVVGGVVGVVFKGIVVGVVVGAGIGAAVAYTVHSKKK